MSTQDDDSMSLEDAENFFVKSPADASVNRRQKHGHDRLYVDGWGRDVYVDLQSEEVEYDGWGSLSMEIEDDEIRLTKDDDELIIGIGTPSLEDMGESVSLQYTPHRLKVVGDIPEQFRQLLKAEGFEFATHNKWDRDERSGFRELREKAKQGFYDVETSLHPALIKDGILQEGDVVIDPDGNEWSVVEIESPDSLLSLPYAELERDGETEKLEVGEYDSRDWLLA